jgi:biopolymer transport protein ExbD
MGAKLAGTAHGKLDLRQNSDMNVTPFVDVMLVLLIIFMVVAPLATVSTNLDLTPTTQPPGLPPRAPTFISIEDNGQLFVSYGQNAIRPTSMDRLGADLAASLGVADPTSERVYIRADRHVRYRSFMNVINQLQQDGYYKISLIAEDLGARPPSP